MKKKHQLFVMIFLIVTACGKHQPDDNKIVVGVFNGNGAGAISVVETIEALKIDKDISPLQISAGDIQSGKLDAIDAIIFPGGSGSKQLNNLGHYGKEKIRRFVLDQGKGIVGICAGAFLTSSTPDYPSLELGNVKVIDELIMQEEEVWLNLSLPVKEKEFFRNWITTNYFVSIMTDRLWSHWGKKKIIPN